MLSALIKLNGLHHTYRSLHVSFYYFSSKAIAFTRNTRYFGWLHFLNCFFSVVVTLPELSYYSDEVRVCVVA